MAMKAGVNGDFLTAGFLGVVAFAAGFLVVAFAAGALAGAFLAAAVAFAARLLRGCRRGLLRGARSSRGARLLLGGRHLCQPSPVVGKSGKGRGRHGTTATTARQSRQIRPEWGRTQN